MEKEAHSSLRIEFFRTFFENVPQLFLQVRMIQILQDSNVESCKQTDSAFYISVATTVFNMTIGILGIIAMLLKKLLKGNLVIAEMVKSF